MIENAQSVSPAFAMSLAFLAMIASGDSSPCQPIMLTTAGQVGTSSSQFTPALETPTVGGEETRLPVYFWRANFPLSGKSINSHGPAPRRPLPPNPLVMAKPSRSATETSPSRLRTFRASGRCQYFSRLNTEPLATPFKSGRVVTFRLISTVSLMKISSVLSSEAVYSTAAFVIDHKLPGSSRWLGQSISDGFPLSNHLFGVRDQQCHTSTFLASYPGLLVLDIPCGRKAESAAEKRL